MKIDAIATDYLGRVRLRLLEESERERFDHLLETCHYLKSSRIGGRHLRYIAEVNGQWVGLLTFSGAAPKLKGREKWIGWSPRQQARRLGTGLQQQPLPPAHGTRASPQPRLQNPLPSPPARVPARSRHRRPLPLPSRRTR